MTAVFAQELDPSGKSPKDPGAKLDANKPLAAQILGMFANALLAVADVGTFGASKYSMGGWQKVENGETRYGDARLRHFLYRSAGEEFDKDSDLPHLAHEAWNALAELELYLRRATPL